MRARRRVAAERAIPMSSDKIPDKYAGAPAAAKSSKAQAYDLFKTFRHAPANAKESQAEPPATPAIKREK